MEEQQNTLKMKIDQKTVFILITVLSIFFSSHLFMKHYKCLQHNHESIQLAVIEIFTTQNRRARFYFQHRFLSDCFALFHKTNKMTLKTDNYEGKNTQEHRLRTLVFTARLNTVKGRDGNR